MRKLKREITKPFVTLMAHIYLSTQDVCMRFLKTCNIIECVCVLVILCAMGWSLFTGEYIYTYVLYEDY